MRVVYDVHVFVHNMLNDESTWPEIVPLPPKTDCASADCISIAFDALEVQLFMSPHIIRNVVRILQQTGHSERVVDDYIDALIDVVEMSGGAVIEPLPLNRRVRDHEDNLILDLVIAVDADVLVSDDADLTALNPWNGRPILRPYEFVNRILQSRRTSLPPSSLS